AFGARDLSIGQPGSVILLNSPPSILAMPSPPARANPAARYSVPIDRYRLGLPAASAPGTAANVSCNGPSNWFNSTASNARVALVILDTSPSGAFWATSAPETGFIKSPPGRHPARPHS